MKKIANRLEAYFFFTPKTLYDLAFFRIAVGLVTIAYFIQMKKDVLDNCGEFGIIRREIQELYIVHPYIPRLTWLCDIFKTLPNYDEEIVLNSLIGLAITASCCMILGLFTRLSAFITWFLFLCFYKSTFLSSYGFESFLCTSLFCCTVMPVGDYGSLENVFRKSQKKSIYHGFSLRVLQLHLCLVYFFGGFFKAMGLDWWTGESIWRALSRQPFNMYDFTWMSEYHFVPITMGISVVILETFYPLFTNFAKSRPYWVALILLMHLGIGIFMGLYLFASTMIVLNITAFEWTYIEKYIVHKKLSLLFHFPYQWLKIG